MSRGSDNDDLADVLCDNIGSVVTVFTQSGGCSGRGFTGLLVSVVGNRFIKLITALPSAPRHPFGLSGDADDFSSCSNRSRFGTSIVIPIQKIVSCCFNEN